VRDPALLPIHLVFFFLSGFYDRHRVAIKINYWHLFLLLLRIPWKENWIFPFNPLEIRKPPLDKKTHCLYYWRHPSIRIHPGISHLSLLFSKSKTNSWLAAVAGGEFLPRKNLVNTFFFTNYIFTSPRKKEKIAGIKKIPQNDLDKIFPRGQRNRDKLAIRKR
jgi:hypothetical protein